MQRTVHFKVVKIISHVGTLESHIVSGDISVDTGNVDPRADLGMIHSEALYFFHIYDHSFLMLLEFCGGLPLANLCLGAEATK